MHAQFPALQQFADTGLLLLRQKKIFVWKTGFWGGQSYGWHYDLMLLVMNVVIITTGGGRFVIF